MDGQFKHGAGYALYGNPPRWHKVHQHKPAPKGAPVVAHEPSSFQAAPASFTPDQLLQLKLPDTNVNAKTFNGQLEKLHGWAAAGDAAAILGASYGTNTYGQKLAKIANHLLGLMGVTHKVAHGQKAGTHAAVQPPAPVADDGAKQEAVASAPAEVKTTPDLQEPGPDAPLAEHVKETLDGKAADGDVEFLQNVAKNNPEHPAIVAYAKQKLAELAPVGPSIADLQASGHLPAASPEPAPTGHAKLDQIPWDTLNLPDTNTNAKSHNAAIAKIKAMAYAGDKAGLQAFIDAKAGAKQTYAKKQHLLAQTALAGLNEGDTGSAKPADVADKTPAKLPLSEVPAYDYLANAKKAKGGSIMPQSAVDDWQAANPGKDGELAEALISLGHASMAADMDLPAPGMEDDAPEPAAAPAPEEVTASTPPKTAAVDAAVFHNTQEGHNKFWSVSVQGTTMKTVYGKIGTKGQSTTKSFSSEAAAQAAAEKLLKDKKAKGYEYAGTMKVEHDAGAVAASADNGPTKEGDTKQGADGLLVLKDGHWVKVGEATNPIDGWKKAIAAGKAPTKEQAAAVEALQDSDPDEYMSAFMEAVHESMPAGIDDDAYDDALQKYQQKASDLHAAALKSPPSVGAPSAQPQAPTPVFVDGILSMDGWEQTGGQGGSNPGGKFKDPSGQEWYCKFPDDADTAKSEVLAAKLYALAGLSGQDAQLITKGGKVGIASKWVNITKASSADALAKVPGALDGFAVDAWLGNWDVVGMSLDNLQIGPDGKAHRGDAGGSLEYRAQGAKKPFGAKVEEIDTLRDAAKNPHAAALFSKIKEADIVASVAKVAAISDVAIRAMVNEYGPGTAAEKAKLAETLIARKQDLIKKYPKAAKAKKKPVFKPEKISAPPSFLNWGGSGKSGPSSKEFLNKANEDSVQAIFAAAKTGNLDAIKNLKAKVYNKDTGAVIGEKPVLEHPSQHVKGYAQQAVNEINYQLNPPKRFRFDGGHPLHALNSAYPSHTGGPSSATAQKLGKFIVLGEPGTLKLEDVGLPAKITHSEGGGIMSKSTYAAAAQAAVAKMPKTQLQAVQSYTGSSYHEMNGSLWNGNPSGAAKAAAEALKTLGHDITPGTVLSRKISLHGADLDALLKAQGKVLEEPAIMSTSIRPSSWSGNVHLKLHVGPGVKGLWVGAGSKPGGGAVSKHGGEDEMILPPNTRLLIISTKQANGKDPDGFGLHGGHIIEAVILPTQ